MSINTKAAEAVIIGTNAAGTKTPDVKKHNTRKRTGANKKTKKKDRPKKNAPLKGDKDQSSVFIPVSDITAPTTHESVTPITHEAIARTDFQIPTVEKKMVVKTIESKFAKEIRNVAAYARVSTLQDEQEESYESQVEYYSAFIKSNPLWNFAGMYADKGISGTQATKRPEFMRMIEDARQGKIDLIIVKSISRFARNTLDSISYVHELKELGIEVRFEKEELSSFDSSSDMIFNLLAAMAQEESRSISENTKWGLKKRAEMGVRRIGSRRMLGYDQEGDKLVPTEDAWIVKYIFEQYAAGALIKDIIAGLKERGAVTMKGKDTFDYTTITGMLKNENYVGDRLIQKQPPQNYLTKKPDYTVDYESYFIGVNEEYFLLDGLH